MDLGTSTTRSTVSDRWRSMRIAKRVARLGGENHRLRAELRMTRSQLERERDHEEEVLASLERASEWKPEGLTKPRGGWLRLAVVGGAAYLFRTKAGRGRYEKIRRRASSPPKDRLASSRDVVVDTSSPGIGPRPNPLTESGIRPNVRRSSIDATMRRSA